MTEVPATLAHDTPLAPLALAATEVGLSGCSFRTAPGKGEPERGSKAARAWLDLARRELDDYFTGIGRGFTVAIDLRGVTALHRRVLDRLTAVRYGDTVTYGALATAVGLVEDGPRRIGGLMARNPVAIVVPCHRVIGAGGNLVGYAGGLATKRWLLDLESEDGSAQLVLDW